MVQLKISSVNVRQWKPLDIPTLRFFWELVSSLLISQLSIVLEYCVRGSLWSTIQNLDIQLSWEDRRRFALDTARGVNYLHTCSPLIIHRDLKSLNLLLDDSYKVKIADFDWTKGLENYITGKIET